LSFATTFTDYWALEVALAASGGVLSFAGVVEAWLSRWLPQMTVLVLVLVLVEVRPLLSVRTLFSTGRL
jgi:hypothetical protein